MRHIAQEIYNDGSRSVVAHGDVPDDAVVVSQPASGQLEWAQNSEQPQCADQVDTRWREKRRL